MRESLVQGKPCFGASAAIPHPFAIEQMAKAGVDWVYIDMQHGLSNLADLAAMFAILKSYGVTPLARVPYEEYSTAQRVLDAGAEGIIFPYIESAAEAKRAVDACKYPPIGIRSFGPYWSPYGADISWANSQILCFVMIESVGGLRNVEDIVSTPGVDGLFVGPNDLSISMGGGPSMASLYSLASSGNVQAGDGVAEALKTITKTALKHGKFVGIQVASGATAATAFKEGFNYVAVGGDSGFLQSACEEEVKAARAGVEGTS